MTNYKPKLIEVALPLVDINRECVREKTVRHGHPSTFHLWWARRPLAAARAVLFASLVDDPSGDPDRFPTAEAQQAERDRLFDLIRRLIPWEASGDEKILAEARREILRSNPDGLPRVIDPFTGGGTIPVEALRLGLPTFAGDLNPVAVLLQRAMLQFPARFRGQKPMNPERSELGAWAGLQGMAADLEYYSGRLLSKAFDVLKEDYPHTQTSNGEPVRPMAWMWVRAVSSPDPSYDGHVPLVKSWVLRKKQGKPIIWVEPAVDRDSRTITYRVREGGQPSIGPTVDRGNGVCLATGAAIPGDYIKAESRSGRMSQQLIAIIAEGPSGRAYCSPRSEDVAAAAVGPPAWIPEGRNPEKLTGGTVFVYGLDEVVEALHASPAQGYYNIY